jgi:ABC-type glutathione transport system ATPase component
MTRLLEVADLRVTFRTDQGAAVAVDGVTFAMNAGETLCVVGESGCGKSVTALSIMGLLPRPSATVAGRVAFEGRELLTLDQSSLADLLQGTMQPDGLAIVMEADHFCMQWRGVKDTDSKMMNSVMRGSFLTDPNLRREFLALLKTRSG